MITVYLSHCKLYEPATILACKSLMHLISAISLAAMHVTHTMQCAQWKVWFRLIKNKTCMHVYIANLQVQNKTCTLLRTPIIQSRKWATYKRCKEWHHMFMSWSNNQQGWLSLYICHFCKQPSQQLITIQIGANCVLLTYIIHLSQLYLYSAHAMPFFGSF